MRERAREIGAELTVWSRVGAGTEVELRVPGRIAYGVPRRKNVLRRARQAPIEDDDR